MPHEDVLQLGDGDADDEDGQRVDRRPCARGATGAGDREPRQGDEGGEPHRCDPQLDGLWEEDHGDGREECTATAPSSWAPANRTSGERTVPAPTRRADTRKANQCAAASPTVTPQMSPVTRVRAASSGTAKRAASRQIATYRAIV